MSSLNKHIKRIKSEKTEYIERIEQIEAYEKEKISALNTTLNAFEGLLNSIEDDSVESKSWQKTIKQARNILEAKKS